MTQSVYTFSFATFRCGCTYQTVDDVTIKCPNHGEILVANDTLRSPTPDVPDIPGLVLNSYLHTPEVLRNSVRNSVHSLVSLQDAMGKEWADSEEDQAGLCAACFIDNEEMVETRITACECGNERCSYRWCGRLDGLHALWMIHAQGRSQETVGIDEHEIFSYGPAQGMQEETQQSLDAERQQLSTEAETLLVEMTNFRNSAAHRPDDPAPPYECPWLDAEYNVMTDPEQQNHHRGIARQNLLRKLTRLQAAGLLKVERPEAEAQTGSESDHTE